ncbi:hypothetical protein BJ138DRAFT_12151 [Hygrophoropsis aurantiaca]|uniref:Uncharacterized protein n=1 Tax=Hygrophoropsis aurantiaca TaxID=72124 RepID=A0ACB8AV88_9AGAM|nr:hypothetical protein BJ138DRAFT_12151 [Hygrophoropsis aurantiaca]
MTSTFQAYPTYGTYQAPYPTISYPPSQTQSPSHYPPQYPPLPTSNPYQPLYNFQPKAPTPSPEPRSAEPDIPAISPEIASKAIQCLILAQLKQSKFEGIGSSALQRFEVEVVAFIHKLHDRAQEFANLANRATPIAKDLLVACDECDVKPKDLHRVAVDYTKNSASTTRVPELIFLPPPPRQPSPELLPSDDEGAPPVVPVTLRVLPPQFPALPPKHTYLRTPASPPKKAALPSLEKKLKTAGLVQESLKNLLLATEENLGQEDGELLGHIVNWEASTYPRKRWRVGS